jgi:hypothetical protein
LTIKQLIASSPPGLIGKIILGAGVGTFLGALSSCVVFLMLEILERVTSDVVQDYEAFAFLLLWFPVQIMIGLGLLVVAVPAWWLLFASKRKGGLEAIIVGAVLGFVFVILVWGGSILWGGEHYSSDFWKGWWRNKLTIAASEALAGAVTGWVVHRTVSRAGLI